VAARGGSGDDHDPERTGSGTDIRIRTYDNPAGSGPFSGTLSAAQFAAARNGPAAAIVAPQAGWLPNLGRI
jgi:hypothetical protein